MDDSLPSPLSLVSGWIELGEGSEVRGIEAKRGFINRERERGRRPHYTGSISKGSHTPAVSLMFRYIHTRVFMLRLPRLRCATHFGLSGSLVLHLCEV